MNVSSIRLRNFRSFVDSGLIELDRVNVLIGPNNSGKSSVIRGLHQVQQGLANIYGDVRVGTREARIDLRLAGITRQMPWGTPPEGSDLDLTITLQSHDRRSGGRVLAVRRGSNISNHGDAAFSSTEPNHFIVPFLSKRKAAEYDEDIRESAVRQVSPDIRYLAAKLSRLANPAYPAHGKYADTCKAVLGFVVTAIPSPNGQRPGVYLPDGETVSIEQMGEGIPNIVQLLCNLAVSHDKLFLLEEPENDLHPTALKALLDLVLSSAGDNQFVVSTHSNIVVSHLCSARNSRLFHVSSEPGVLPTIGRISALDSRPETRSRVLRELGYSFSDFDLWDGWLLLEESSAERIIKDYLVPWFAPKLARVRTVSAAGVTNVEPAFADLYRLVLFTHLLPAYAERVWVRVDGDAPGRAAVERLRAKFPSINQSQIDVFSAENFEVYYPEVFRGRVNRVLSISDRVERRAAKQELLREVMGWLDEDEARGRAALSESAHAVIRELQQIHEKLQAR